jgi:hypothetical protein
VDKALLVRVRAVGRDIAPGGVERAAALKRNRGLHQERPAPVIACHVAFMLHGAFDSEW